jgi:hypothetical protein
MQFEIIVMHRDFKFVACDFDEYRRVIHHQPEWEFHPKTDIKPWSVPVQVVPQFKPGFPFSQ